MENDQSNGNFYVGTLRGILSVKCLTGADNHSLSSKLTSLTEYEPCEENLSSGFPSKPHKNRTVRPQ